MSTMDDMREELMATLRDLRNRDKPLEIDRARAAAQVAAVLVDSARAEVEYLKVTKLNAASNFITPTPVPTPEHHRTASGGQVERTPNGLRHHLPDSDLGAAMSALPTQDAHDGVCQRWRGGRDSYRPAGELFDPSRAEVSVIDQAAAKLFVQQHHYSASFPASRLNVGLFRKRAFGASQLCGVATFSVPMTQSVIPAYFPELKAADGLELGRFILLDSVEANAETWMLARAFKAVRKSLPQVRGIVAYCDPLPRYNSFGEQVKRGHIGTIYKAHNAQFRGRSRKRTLLLTPSGVVANERSLSKLRNAERGAEGVERDLRLQGAPKRHFAESGREWVQRLVDEGFLRKVPHPGNLAYSWKLH